MSICTVCGGKSEFSLNWLISTRQARPRRQKCSRSVILCESCLRNIARSIGTNLAGSLFQSLHEAYTAMAQDCEERA